MLSGTLSLSIPHYKLMERHQATQTVGRKAGFPTGLKKVSREAELCVAPLCQGLSYVNFSPDLCRQSSRG